MAAPEAPRGRSWPHTAGPVEACQGIEPRIHTPIGNITAAATKARMAAKTTFSTATAPIGQRGEQAVLDLVAVGELDDQGKRRALQAGEDGGQGHQPRKQHQFVAGPGVPELGEHLAEHEEEEEGLQDDLGQEDAGTPGR